MTSSDRRRTAIRTLAASQALGLAVAPIVVVAGGIVGAHIAPSPSLATLPIAATVVGTAAGAAPAAWTVGRLGRRRGFTLAALLGMVAALLGASAVATAAFPPFCLATFGLGFGLAFVMQYRFAAAELAGSEGAPRAVALVLAGGIAAGVLGPEVARLGRDLFRTPWTGSFFGLALLQLLLAALLYGGLGGEDRVRREDGARGKGAARSRAGARRGRTEIGSLLRRAGFRRAVTAGMAAYAVMTLVMTATPLAMHHAGFGADATSRVIQLHMVAMYLPSLVAGRLARVGLRALMATGALTLLASLLVGWSPRDQRGWLVALGLLGVGWNLLFLSGTVALTRAVPDDVRVRAQALNDVLVFGCQAAASIGAGAILAGGGWRGVVGVALVLPVALLLGLWRDGRRGAVGTFDAPREGMAERPYSRHLRIESRPNRGPDHRAEDEVEAWHPGARSRS